MDVQGMQKLFAEITRDSVVWNLKKFNDEQECLKWIRKIAALKRGDEIVDDEDIHGIIIGFEDNGWKVVVGVFDQDKKSIGGRGVPISCIKEIIPA